MGRLSKWSPEFREEAVRMQRESGESITAVARRLGMSPETLRNWVRRDEVERGERDGLTIAEHAEIRELRRPGAPARGGEVDPAEGGGVFRLSASLRVVLSGLARYFAARPVFRSWSVSLSCRPLGAAACGRA
jgi:transposase